MMNKKARAKRVVRMKTMMVGTTRMDIIWTKYNDVEDFPFELDNTNLKMVTGLKKLIGEEDLEESDNDEEGNGVDDGELGAGKIGDDEEEYDMGAEKEVVIKRRSK